MHKVPVFLIETKNILRRYCSHSTKYVRFAIPLCLHEVTKYCLIVQLCSCLVTPLTWTLRYFLVYPRGYSFEFTRYSFPFTWLERLGRQQFRLRMTPVENLRSKNSILKNFRSLSTMAPRKGWCKIDLEVALTQLRITFICLVICSLVCNLNSTSTIDLSLILTTLLW